MLHMDVLLLIYHFARFGRGNVLEIAGGALGSASGSVNNFLSQNAVPENNLPASTISPGSKLICGGVDEIR
jgi:hypothetical protein